MKPIVLIGFMGCGKSVLGRQLARAHKKRFVDLDRALSREQGRTIPQLFKRLGEGGFRRLETGVLRRQLRQGGVLASGGGMPTVKQNQTVLKARGAIVVWVDPKWELLWKRLCAGNLRERPLLIDSRTGRPKTERAVRALWSRRNRDYRRCARIRLRVRDGESPGATLKRLLALLS